MAVAIDRQAPDIAFSLFRWLKNIRYSVAGGDGALADYHAGLKIVQGYPDDLTKVTGPTVAMESPDGDNDGTIFMGGAESSSEDIHMVNLYGFVVLGTSQSDQAHKIYRDRLKNDLVQLLKRAATNEGITLYDSSTKNAIGAIEVLNVTSRLIPVSASAVRADLYKFVIQFEVPFMTGPDNA